MILKKLITKNTKITSVIGSNINEYDIKSAHSTAMRYLRGDEFYHKLMAMSKLERNIYIGKMIATDNKSKGHLYKDIESLLLEWMNTFIEVNHIQDSNFIETTRDSVMIVNKIPMKTSFDKGKVKFLNKDGSFTSLYRFNGKLLIFDSMTQNIRIKGVSDITTQASPFVKQYLIPLLSSIESSMPMGPSQVYKVLARFRSKYIINKNIDIYRELDSDNKFCIQMGEDIMHLDMSMDEENGMDDSIIRKELNYTKYVMPIMKSAIAY